VVTRRLRAMCIRDKPTASASPWQNGFAERLIGSIRRECVDHIIGLREMHLRRVLRRHFALSRIQFDNRTWRGSAAATTANAAWSSLRCPRAIGRTPKASDRKLRDLRLCPISDPASVFESVDERPLCAISGHSRIRSYGICLPNKNSKSYKCGSKNSVSLTELCDSIHRCHSAHLWLFCFSK
jgi:hypothetical protein